MKWYNRIFKMMGNRRLFTRREYLDEVRLDMARRELRVVERRDHELLLEIAALANIVADVTRSQHPAVRKLRLALQSYKIREADRNPPPSTITHEEEVLMEIPL